VVPPNHPKENDQNDHVIYIYIILVLKPMVFWDHPKNHPLFRKAPNIGTVGHCLFDDSVWYFSRASAMAQVFENQEPMKTLQPHELQFCLEVIKEPVRSVSKDVPKTCQRLCSSFEMMIQND
jgi:hypothetical protein